jgi:16S rRNA (cytidine1402-2'-O)-methyltransferase
MPSEPAAAGSWLALVATPIGNLDDITLRAIETLRQAEVIAAEDTRRARILCVKFDLHARLLPYHAFNEHHRTQALLDEVAAGRRVVVLADAGTPAISDPGFFLVRAARERGIEPRIIPGVSALTFAVAAAGLPVDHFAFWGFPPVKPGKRRTFLERIRVFGGTSFVFESPFRVNRLLAEGVDVCGPQTRVALIREATKLHEECLCGTAQELLAKHGQREWKGEFVVALRPAGTAVPAERPEGRDDEASDGTAASPTSYDSTPPAVDGQPAIRILCG